MTKLGRLCRRLVRTGAAGQLRELRVFLWDSFCVEVRHSKLADETHVETAWNNVRAYDVMICSQTLLSFSTCAATSRRPRSRLCLVGSIKPVLKVPMVSANEP